MRWGPDLSCRRVFRSFRFTTNSVHKRIASEFGVTRDARAVRTWALIPIRSLGLGTCKMQLRVGGRVLRLGGGPRRVDTDYRTGVGWVPGGYLVSGVCGRVR